MKLRALPLFLLATVAVVACNAEVGDEEETEQVEEAIAKNGERCATRERSDEDEAKVRNRTISAKESAGEIAVHVHVIQPKNADYGVSDRRIDQQILMLNQGFRGTGFGFRLASVDRTANDTWAAKPSKHERAWKKKLHRGNMKDLNLYIVRTPGSTLGWAYLPDDLPKDDPRMDGVVVEPETLPGGTPPYELGLTAVHEVGHWLGLEHVFKGGCDAKNGDFVADTPAEKGMHYGCEIGRNSCPNRAGVDSVHNYMSYSDDTCLNEFTNGQKRRMRRMWSVYRAK